MKILKSPVSLLAALILLALNVGSANAALSIGNTIETTYLFPTESSFFAGPSLISGPTSSLSNFAGALDISFTDSSISVQLTRDGGPNNVAIDGVRFVDIGGDLGFENFAVDLGETTVPIFGFSKTPNTLFINFAGIQVFQGQTITLNTSAVPIPATFWLLSSAFCVAGLARRRRSCQSVPGG